MQVARENGITPDQQLWLCFVQCALEYEEEKARMRFLGMAWRLKESFGIDLETLCATIAAALRRGVRFPATQLHSMQYAIGPSEATEEWIDSGSFLRLRK